MHDGWRLTSEHQWTKQTSKRTPEKVQIIHWTVKHGMPETAVLMSTLLSLAQKVREKTIKSKNSKVWEKSKHPH